MEDQGVEVAVALWVGFQIFPTMNLVEVDLVKGASQEIVQDQEVVNDTNLKIQEPKLHLSSEVKANKGKLLSKKTINQVQKLEDYRISIDLS
jgi:hypothetical protein